MNEFNKLLEILDRLLGPNGCPWDQEQTMETIRTTVLEEVCELIEAIDEKDDDKIADELGDLFLNAAFFCKLGEKESRFTTQQVLHNLNEKLIRRHPHIFSDAEVKDSEEVIAQWERIKKNEKNHHHRKSALDGIPKGLPALARAQKVLKRMKRAHYKNMPGQTSPKMIESEEDFGKALLHLVDQAKRQGIDIELTLRKNLSKVEKEFRLWEEEQSS